MIEDPNDPFNVPPSTYPQSISRAESESSVDTMVASEKENDGSGDLMMKDVDEGVGGGGVSMAPSTGGTVGTSAFALGSKLPRTRSRVFRDRGRVDSPGPGNGF